ncbi:MAG: hypothetical protein LBH94_00720 [Deltaproteobacteria bacterium]|jgi:hypothetical protein|nr:hypothetical protein [Deltaproteobacteria bacterium]
MSIATSHYIPPAKERPPAAQRKPGQGKSGRKGAAPFSAVLSEEKSFKPDMDRVIRQSDVTAQANTERKRAQALVSLAQALEGNTGNALESARNALSVRKLMTLAGNFDLTPPSAASKGVRRKITKYASSQDDGLGSLSAQFESGKDGIYAIGYDRVGGTSYGKYQISSRVGTMSNFLSFLDKQAPDLAKRLRAAGPANTGSRRGKMPETWQQIAEEQPARFEALQEKFIHDSHYAPALNAVTKTAGIDPARLSPAMQEVLWSTAVQHGPAGAARIFHRAVSKGVSDEMQTERNLIDNVYAIRADQFGASSEQVRSAIRTRLRQEKAMALAMLSPGNKLA